MEFEQVDNNSYWEGDNLIVRLEPGASSRELTLALRRLQLGGARVAAIRTVGGSMTVDPTGSAADIARRAAAEALTQPIQLVVTSAPGVDQIDRCCADRTVEPEAASSSVRRSALLLEKLSGRTLSPKVTRDVDGRWSFSAVSKPQTGRPMCLRERMALPSKRSQYDPGDSIDSWGFQLAFSAWRKSAPAFDFVWLHPSGVSVHLAARPVDDQSGKSMKRVYELAVDGLLNDVAQPPYAAAHPGREMLRSAVAETVSAWVRFGAAK